MNFSNDLFQQLIAFGKKLEMKINLASNNLMSPPLAGGF